MNFLSAMQLAPSQWYALSGILNAVFSLVIAVMVLFHDKKNPLYRTYFLFGISVFAWSMCYTVWAATKDSRLAAHSFHGVMVFAIFVPVFYFHHLCYLLNIRLQQRQILIAGYIGAFAISASVFTPYFMHDFHRKDGFNYWPDPGPFFHLYLLFFSFYVLYGLYGVLKSYRAASWALKKQLQYVLLASAIGWAGGLTDFPLWYDIPLPPYGNILVSVYVFITAYAIVKHHLMDIRIVVRKTVIYSIVTAVLAAVYVATITLFAHFLGSSKAISSAVAACAITLLFHPLLRRVQRIMERYFFQQTLDEQLFGEFASGFVHEMKGPLANISLPAEVTLMDLRDVREGKRSLDEIWPKIEQRLKYIMDQSIDTSLKIEAIREVSRLSQDQSPVEPVAVGPVLQACLSELEKLLEQTKVEVRIALNPLPPVRGHTKRLQIVFTNLIKNAAEAMKQVPGERTITIQGHDQGDVVLITIKDTGPGIKPEDVAHLFEPYYSTKGARGMGIGLYLSQRIIKAAGGSIEAKSEEGKGAEFRVRLPKYATKACVTKL